jgi:hypothetical protein
MSVADLRHRGRLEPSLADRLQCHADTVVLYENAALGRSEGLLKHDPNLRSVGIISVLYELD